MVTDARGRRERIFVDQAESWELGEEVADSSLSRSGEVSTSANIYTASLERSC